jgi:flagellar motor switch protein FliM
MAPTLPLDQIGALREKARGKTWAVRPPEESASVSPFDPRQSGQLSPEQTRGLETLHKNCALKMADALGTLLRTSLEVNLAAIEQGSYTEFVERVAEPAYLLSFRSALGACAALQIDLSLVFPFLDLILGGSGGDAIETRDLTEIEQELLEPACHAIGRSLQEGWQPLLKATLAFDRRLQKSETSPLLSAGGKLLLVSFDVRLQEKQSRLLLALPGVIATALLRGLAPQDTAPPAGLPQDRGRLQEQLLNSRFATELLLPRSTVSVRQLYGLQPGDVLTLQVRSNELLPVHIAGRHMFLASPARCGSQRGAQVQKVLSVIPENKGEERK